MNAASFQIRPTALPGCVELLPRRQQDERGGFVKVFHRDTFAQLGLETEYPEVYYSHSRQGVIRGLHFQLPPAHQAKLVFCTQGRVQDAVVDLRVGSPAYRQYVTLELSAVAANLIYIPPGLAHGFCVLSDWATLVYQVGSQYAPDLDAGVLWNSVGIPWATSQPIISDRDMSHPPLAEFASTFRYSAEGLITEV
ncbi:MAG: dTDP-4-dehydrorhamnose 3,5-epimerase [Candidatus Competibacteraceae bacterium]|nr:dTDP-4-dehydrorhamnose 3,5-epimerase [Candidatus Competibacteraceae bacterium]